MASSVRSVVPVWALAAAGAIAVGVVEPTEALIWLPVVMAGSVLVTFAIQLGVSRKEGFAARIVASLGGALAILAIATLVLWLTALR